MKAIYEVILLACFIVSNVIESVVTEEGVASISENSIEHAVKEPSLSTRSECRKKDECCGCNKQCCSNVCNLSEKKCTCKEMGAPCSYGRECCVGTCLNGVCECKEVGAECEKPAECCRNTCDLGTCKSCTGPFEPGCRNTAACCRGICFINGPCFCFPQGASCNQDRDCCNGLCEGGKCTCVLGDCVPNGPLPCCLGGCIADANGKNTCSEVPLNGGCRVNVDCQSLLCASGTCKCAKEGEPCTYNAQRCDLANSCGNDQTPGICVLNSIA